jgi:hypothetical protein
VRAGPDRSRGGAEGGAVERHLIRSQAALRGAASSSNPSGQPLTQEENMKMFGVLRLQHRADVASAAAGRRLRDGRHPHRRAGHLRRRARQSHPRGRDLRRRSSTRTATARCSRRSRSCSRRSRASRSRTGASTGGSRRGCRIAATIERGLPARLPEQSEATPLHRTSADIQPFPPAPCRPHKAPNRAVCPARRYPGYPAARRAQSRTAPPLVTR